MWRFVGSNGSTGSGFDGYRARTGYHDQGADSRTAVQELFLPAALVYVLIGNGLVVIALDGLACGRQKFGLVGFKVGAAGAKKLAGRLDGGNLRRMNAFRNLPLLGTSGGDFTRVPPR